MDVAGRALTPAVLKALTYWPGIVHARGPKPVDLAVLPPFFNDLLGEFPWWNSTWRVTQVEPAYPREVASDHDRQKNRFTEVSVPGTLGGGAGQALPFFARVRFEGNRLLRFQAKIADMVVGPALAEAGAPEPHPFGAVLRKLMDNREVSVKELARQTARAMSTINAARTGWHNPHPVLVRELARAVGIPEADLAAIAGIDDATFGVSENTSTKPGGPTVATHSIRHVRAQTRHQLAGELIDELTAIDGKIKAADKQLRQLVAAARSSLGELNGIGPSGAARLIGDIGDIARFRSAAHFAS